MAHWSSKQTFGFPHCTPIEVPTHLQTNGATLDNFDIQALISTIDSALNPTEDPATQFECDNKIEQQLKKIGIPPDLQHCLTLIKAAVICSGTLDATICK